MEINKNIYINSTIGSTRIAILENSTLSDIYVELPDHKKMVGNIYKGKVQNVIPGMQAAFVDVGYSANAFLPFSEVNSINDLNNVSFSVDDDENNKKNNKSQNRDKKINYSIGDEIIVQVIKEPFSSKGPRISTNISLSGSLLVLVPNQNYIGISRKISDKYEKKRLKNIIHSIKPKNFGVIVRTISAGKDQKIIENDLKELLKTWKNIDSQIKKSKPPTLLYTDHNISNLVIKDLFTDDINELHIDNKPIYKRILSYTKKIDSEKSSRIKYYNSKLPIFDNHNIEDQITKALKNRVWLKSGAYLIIDHTEAMVVIDINSGRFIGKKSHEENSLKINLESANEIARQLRIRDIGGLIVIDFIDLFDIKNRKKVYEELKRKLKSEKTKVSISEFSEFGLMQITRQRVGLSLLHSLTDECNVCNGLGRNLSKDTTLTSIQNWIKRYKTKYRDRRLVLYVNESMDNYFKNTRKNSIAKLIFKNWIWIESKIDSSLQSNQYRVYSKSRKKDVTNEV